MCRCITPQLQSISVAWALKKLYLCRSCQGILHDEDLPAGALDGRAEPVGRLQAAGIAEQERLDRLRS